MNEIRNLDWDEIKLRLARFATCEAGRVQLAGTQALATINECREQFLQIEDAVQILGKGIRPFCQSLDLFTTWHSRLQKKATLKTLELRDVRQFAIEVIALHETLEPFESQWARHLKSGLMQAEEPLSAIDQIMTADGEIRHDASETMFRLWNEKSQQSRLVQTTLDRILKNHQLETSLQEKYVTTREGRWVLPVKSSMRHGLEGIIHSTSQSKQTVFMEPQEVVPLNNRVREIEIEIEAEIEKLLMELSEYLATLVSDFESSKDILLEFDIRSSQAQLAIALNARPCDFDDSKVELRDLRHPLLALNNVKVVPNDVDLDIENRILLLSGPNAGGKTVLLKALGLAAQMARCGLFIAARENSKLPFFKDLTVSIGDQQSVDANLSTFAAHLKTLNMAASAKGPQHLLLIDEICGSTDPEEGAALARSFIEAYSANKVFAIVSSHLGALKTGWSETSGVVNGSLEFNREKGPTYRFLKGVAGQSLAIQTAKRVGVAQEILDKALSFLTPEHRQFQKDLEQVDKLRHELSDLKDELESQKARTEKEREKYSSIISKFQKEKEEMLNQSVKRAERKVDTIIRESKIDDIFKRHQELEKIKVDLPKIVKASTKRDVAPEPTIKTADDFAAAFPPGSKVFVSSIGRDAIVQGKPNGKGEVAVLSQSMRFMVPWQDARPPEMASNPTKDIMRKSQHYSFLPGNQDRVVDVRGKKVDEAIALLETQLDIASVHQEDRIKIIHGHGTDSLKKAIRSHLSRSVYVKKWQAGTAETGGDGLTWAELKD